MEITFSSGLTLNLSDRLYAVVLEQAARELSAKTDCLQEQLDMHTDNLLGLSEPQEKLFDVFSKL